MRAYGYRLYHIWLQAVRALLSVTIRGAVQLRQISVAATITNTSSINATSLGTSRRLGVSRATSAGYHPFPSARAVLDAQTWVVSVQVAFETMFEARSAVELLQAAIYGCMCLHHGQVPHMVTGCITYGYGLYHIWLQAVSHMVTGCITYGYRLYHIWL